MSWVYGLRNQLLSIIHKNVRNKNFGSLSFSRIPDFLCFSLIWNWGCNSFKNIFFKFCFSKMHISSRRDFPSLFFQGKVEGLKCVCPVSAGEAHFWHKCHPWMQRTHTCLVTNTYSSTFIEKYANRNTAHAFSTEV